MAIEVKEKVLLYVFIILDKYGIQKKNSILNIELVTQIVNEKGEDDFDIRLYLEDFPFSYYVVVENTSELLDVIHTILMKWICLTSEEPAVLQKKSELSRREYRFPDPRF